MTRVISEYIGKKYGRLTIINTWRNEESRSLALCKCECETEKVLRLEHVIDGMTTSCGCYAREVVRKASIIHGETRTRLFRTWTHIRQRCNNPSNKAYPGYGGRGIKVCNEWNSFLVFRDWANDNGYAPELTIDRIDNDGDYSPDNCRWVPKGVQATNRRSSVKVSAFGETKCAAEWARDARCSVGYQALLDRMERGMEPEAAISIPVMHPHDWRLERVK